MASQAVTPVTCSNCHQKFGAAVQRILDVGKDPTVKGRLLQGRVNVATCPSCGATGRLNAPFIYHDPARQLLLVFSPIDLGVQEQERQRIIGELTKSVMDSLPLDQRKSYLFQPQIFLTMQSFIDQILEADGITKEVREAQRARSEALNAILRSATDETALKKVVEEKRALLDKQFFDLLFASAQTMAAEGQAGLAEQMLALHEMLADMVGLPEAKETMRKYAKASRDALMKQLEAATTPEQMDAVVAGARPVFDYQFFQSLTADIDAARGAGDKAQADRLITLRSDILEAADRIDAAAQEAMAQIAELIQAALSAKDPDALLRSRLEELDETFLAVISANIQAAEQKGEKELAVRLSEVAETALRLIRESLPPEIAFINSLLQATFPDGAKALLSQNREMITPELMTSLRQLQSEMEQMGRLPEAQRLGNIYALADGMTKPQILTAR